MRFVYRSAVANEINLKECLNDNPLGLHFSGHGFQNKPNLFDGDKKGLTLAKGKGDCLCFEKNNGAS
jgi:hypothetical protein